MKKKKTEDEMFLNAVKQSRPREPMPRPVIFKDKTKFDRNKEKEELRKRKEEYEDEDQEY